MRDSLQASLQSLAELIQGWLSDVPLQVSASKKTLTDSTLDNRTYDATHIQITNGNKTATFAPDALYYMGAMGGVNLSINRPNQHLHKKHMLFMSNTATSGWIVSSTTGQNHREDNELTEDIFFKLIESLI